MVKYPKNIFLWNYKCKWIITWYKWCQWVSEASFRNSSFCLDLAKHDKQFWFAELKKLQVQMISYIVYDEQVSSQKLWTWLNPNSAWTTRRASLLSETMNFDWTQTVHEQPGEQVSSQKLWTWLNPNSAWTTRRASLLSETTNLIEPKQCMNNQENDSGLCEPLVSWML